MPRRPDPGLPSRIAEAAHALWRKGGDPVVTIRDVAAKAATTTPSVYAHYRDRNELLAAARRVAHEPFVAEMAKSTDLLDACARMLAFADSRPRDYELLFGHGFRDRAGADALAAEFAQFEIMVRRSGISEREVRRTALALRNLVHGAAMFRLAHARPGPLWTESRDACLSACALLIDVALKK